MSKKIIHFQIPTDERGNIIVSREIVWNFCKELKRILPKYYLPIVSPFKIDVDRSKIKFNIAALKRKISDENMKYIKDEIEKEGYTVEIIK